MKWFENWFFYRRNISTYTDGLKKRNTWITALIYVSKKKAED